MASNMIAQRMREKHLAAQNETAGNPSAVSANGGSIADRMREKAQTKSHTPSRPPAGVIHGSFVNKTSETSAPENPYAPSGWQNAAWVPQSLRERADAGEFDRAPAAAPNERQATYDALRDLANEIAMRETAKNVSENPYGYNQQYAYWVPQSLREQENERLGKTAPGEIDYIAQSMRALEADAYEDRVKSAQQALDSSGLRDAYDYLRKAQAYEDWQQTANVWRGGGLGDAQLPAELAGFVYDEARAKALRKQLSDAGVDYDTLSEYDDRQKRAVAAEARRQGWQDEIENGGFGTSVLASAATVAASPLQGLDLLNMLPYIGKSNSRDLNTYTPIDPNTFVISDYLNTVRGAVSKKIEEKTDWEMWGQNVASFLYQTGMSMADSAAQMAMFGPGATYVMGLSAAANGARETLQNGGTNTQAFLSGLAQGTAEALFENVSIENLLKKKSIDSVGRLVREVLKQGATEASEEVFTEITNILTDAIIMGDNSDNARAVREYMADGMSREDARKRVLMDNIQQIVLSGVGGAISGGVMGGFANAYQFRQLSKTGADTRGNGQRLDYLLDAAAQTDEQSDAYRRGQQIRAAQEGGQRVNNASYGALQMEVENEQALRDQADVLALAAIMNENEDGSLPRSIQRKIDENPYAAEQYAKLKARQQAAQARTETVSEGTDTTATEKRAEGQETAAEAKATPAGEEYTSTVTRGEDGKFTMRVTDSNGAVMTEQRFDSEMSAYDAAADLGFAPARQSVATSDEMRNRVGIRQDLRTRAEADEIGKRGVQTLLLHTEANRRGGVKAYYDAFKAYYDAGLTDADYYDVQAEGYYPDGLKRAAYEAGEYDRKFTSSEEIAKIPFRGNGLHKADYAYAAGAYGVKTADDIQRVAEKLGVEVRFVDLVNGGTANAEIDGRIILMEKGNSNPVYKILGHEWTHRIQDLSKDAYDEFKDSIKGELGDAVEAIKKNYKDHGMEITDDNALDEAVADYAGEMLADGRILDDFIKANRDKPNVLRRMWEAIKKLLDKLTGAEKQTISEAEQKLRAALEAAEKAAIAEDMKADSNAAEAEEDAVRYSLITDKELRERLERGDTVTVYRAMQIIDGKLYPPMAAKVAEEAGKGKKRQLVEPTQINEWYQSDERPELADENGMFTLDKGNGKTIKARYNPYFHTSATPLNDQFSSAYARPNLVTVEAVIPKSELTSGYKAEKAKDAVGEVQWHSGPVASQLKGDKARRVFLSRYTKVLRVMPDAEVARIVAKTLNGENVAVPSNVVTPSLLAELEKQGVQIEYATGEDVKRLSLKDMDVYNRTAVLKESTVDKYLADYAAKSSPNYAQAYIVRMSPTDFVNLTTSRAGRQIIEQQTGDLNMDELQKANVQQPIQLNIDHETGEISGHEGRHRALALARAGVTSVPVLLFDSSNKYSKKAIDSLILTGQDFGSSRSTASVAVSDLQPLNYANRDAVVEKFTTSGDANRDADIRYSLITPEQDADYLAAVERGDTETAQRMVDEAASAAGYAVRKYHGTKANFTEFDPAYSLYGASGFGLYFGDKEIADEFGKNGRMLTVLINNKRIGTLKTHYISADQYETAISRLGLSPEKTYKYMGADTVEEYVRAHHDYRLATDLQYWAMSPEKYAVDSATTAKSPKDIISILNDSLGLDGIERGRELVLWDNRLVKLADPVTYDDDGKVNPLSERFNPEKKDIRFSMKSPVEEKQNLIALHNLNAEKLGKALDLGGFPMPSIAVTKTDIPHTNFGDITLVMDKSTINPQADRRNTVYSADAWTPTFPAIEYEADEKAAAALRKRYYEMRKKYGDEATRPLYSWGNYADDKLTRRGGIENVIDGYRDDPDMMKLYLLENGMDVPAPVIEETVSRLDDETVAFYDHFINALGKGAFEELYSRDGESPIAARKRWWAAHGEEFDSAYKDYMLGLGFSAEEIDNVLENETVASQTRKAVEIRNYLRNGAEKRTTSTNTAATNDAIRALVDAEKYDEWLHGLFDGLEKSRGIYNGRDRYTPSGNERSFSATHYPVTLENVARAMAAQNDGNSRNVDGFYGVKSLRAGMAKRFSSIAEMHEYEGRLQHLTEDEAQQITDALSDRMTAIMGEVYDTKQHSKYDNSFIEMDRIGEILMEITEQKKITVDSIEKVFAKYGYKIGNELAVDIRNLLFDVSQMPVNIFEAKPERAVRFDEVMAAVVPSDTEAALVQRLKDAGVQSVLEYEKGNDADRMEKANSVEGARFSLKSGEDALANGGDVVDNENRDYGTEGVDYGRETGDRKQSAGRSGLAVHSARGNGLAEGARRQNADGRSDRGEHQKRPGQARLYEELSDYDKYLVDEYLFYPVDNDPEWRGVLVDPNTGNPLSLEDAAAFLYNGVMNNTPLIQTMRTQIPEFDRMAQRAIDYFTGTDAGQASAGTSDRDNQGRSLSKGQQAYFKDSKSRDAKTGALKVMYHGSPEEVFVFDRKKSSTSNLYGRGFYFADTPDLSTRYGADVTAYYLNIVNPMSPGQHNITKSQMRTFLQAVAENEDDYDFWNYGQDATVDSVLNELLGKGDFEMLQDVSATAIGDLVAAAELFNEVNGTTYDGFILPTESVTFSSEQAKRIDNLTPSTNPDTRRSLKSSSETPTMAQLMRENERLTERVEHFKGQLRLTKDWTADERRVRQFTRGLISEFGADLSTEERAALTEDVKALVEYAHRNTRDADYQARMQDMAYDVARRIVKNARTLSEGSDVQLYNEVRSRLQAPMIIDQRYAHDISPDKWGEWRNANRGKVNVSINGKGAPVDTVYKELSEAYPWLFPAEITNPADQVMQMVDAVETLTPVFENPYSADMAYAVEFAANAVLDSVMDDALEAAPTFADRKKAQIQAERKANWEYTQEMMRRVRDKRDQQIKAIMDYNRESQRRRAERREDSETRTRLLKIARRLQNKKLPAVTRALLEQYIGDLDTAAKSITGATLENLSALRDWYEKQKATDPDFIADPATEAKIARLGKRRIADLSAAEVAELTEVLLNIENELRNERRIIDSEDRRDTRQMALESIYNVEETDGSKKNLADWMASNTLSPLRLLRRLTGYVDTDPLYLRTQELADGQRKMLDYQMRAERMFSKWANDEKFIDRIRRKERIKITGLEHGNPVTLEITPDMRMALYLHSLNDQNMRHIAKGGVTIPDIDLYLKGDLKEAYARGRTVVLSPSNVRAICKDMSDAERAYARAAHDYFNGMSRDEVNATSEKLVGYSIAGVDNYFPIETDRNFTKANIDELKRDGTIEGMGFLKERVNASNAINLVPMTDVLNRSIKNHAKYVGLAVPVRNFGKIWGMNAQNDVAGESNGLRKAISSKWGSRGVEAIENMITDLQSQYKRSDDIDKLFGKIRSNYAGAVLSLNLSVAMKQAASYPTAAAVLGWGPLAKAMKNFGSVDLDLIAKYTPLQWYRSQGYSSQEQGDIKARQGMMDKVLNAKVKIGGKDVALLNWIQGVDLMTTRKLWKASEYYVRDNNKDLKIGSEEYYRAVADVYNRVIEETQPNYTTMQRPQLLRSKSAWAEMLGMFKTQPFQNFNVLYDAIGELRAAERMAKNGDDSKLKAAKKNAANAVSSQIVQLAVFAAMTALWGALRKRDDKWRDKEGNMTAASVALGIGKDMLSGAASMFPAGSDIYNVIESAITGGKYYGASSVTVSAISDALAAVQKAGVAINKVVGDIQDGKNVNYANLGKAMENLVLEGSKALGVPAENIRNNVQIVMRISLVAADGEYMGSYEYIRLTENMESSYIKGDVYDLLYKAYLNDPAAHRELYRQMVKDGFKPDSIKTAMEKRMKEAQGVKSVNDLKRRYNAP